MKYTFRPLPNWPYTPTKPRRYGHFKSTFNATLNLLALEIGRIDGKNVVVGAGFRESDLRMDGMPRSDRRQEPYYERKAAFAQLRGALAVYDRVAER